MGNRICHSEKESTEKQPNFPERKWEDTVSLSHSSKPIWLSSEETEDFFNRYIQRYIDSYGVDSSAFCFTINPWNQTISLKVNTLVQDKAMENIPYIGHEWIADSIQIYGQSCPIGIRIPRADLRSSAILDGFSYKKKEHKRIIESRTTKDIYSMIEQYST